jgi:hypothetical protein
VLVKGTEKARLTQRGIVASGGDQLLVPMVVEGDRVRMTPPGGTEVAITVAEDGLLAVEGAPEGATPMKEVRIQATGAEARRTGLVIFAATMVLGHGTPSR